MPVLLVDRDPVLVSIDQQRLADLGIPSAVIHDHAESFYGPRGVMWLSLAVPEGWQEALPDELPVQEEWDAAAWEQAQQDSSNERPEHSRPISITACIGCGVVLAGLCWIGIDGAPLAGRMYELSKEPGATPFQDRIVWLHLQNAIPLLGLGAVCGSLASAIGQCLGSSVGRVLLAALLAFFYYGFPLLFAALIAYFSD
ncbi:hypothetical protein [Luteolibacter sp. LG18]|uniref:hypothetical protein n=1 Tax=Luteolibacter sp. LG18 TaxID=2819286 RepID=UPI002B2D8922|nr:hypothetical protein llg_00640 [Luteolibacter sp. LG18]